MTKIQEGKIEITPTMEKAIDAIRSGGNIFITGKAGTGKSTLLGLLTEKYLKGNYVIVAPTGVAALNVGGSTIHKFFGFQPDITLEKVNSNQYHPRNQKIMRSLNTLIIDEISMVRADLLDNVDAALRRYGPNKDKPFGGIQLIFVGDLFQLPPIVTYAENKFIDSNFGSPFFFSSKAMSKVIISTIELDKVYRQKDLDFVEILNAIRINEVSEPMLEKLNKSVDSKFEPGVDDFFVTLVATNALASEINQRNLSKLPGKLEQSDAVITGDLSKDEMKAEVKLTFKVGSQIMLLNNDGEERWVNGTMARIQEVHLSDQIEDSYVLVEIEGSKAKLKVHRHTWDIKRPRSLGTKLVYDTIGSFNQFPFMLAWAVTIHKSQGKTFDKVIVDLSVPVFSAGQLYVALSRCRTMEGTILRQPITDEQVIVDPRVVEYSSGEHE